MAVFVVDAVAAIDLAGREYLPQRGDCDLFALTLLRSQVLSLLHAKVTSGSVAESEARALAERACRLPHRLLGDAVLRRTAWTIATEHGWPDTFDAEYVALTRLHAVALIAGSVELFRKAELIVPTETVDSFLAGAGARG